MVSDDDSSPDAVFLSRFDGIVETVAADGAGGAEFLSRLGGLSADFGVWEIFREEHLWQPLAGYFPDCLDFEEKVARWMSVVEHRFTV